MLGSSKTKALTWGVCPGVSGLEDHLYLENLKKEVAESLRLPDHLLSKEPIRLFTRDEIYLTLAHRRNKCE